MLRVSWRPHPSGDVPTVASDPRRIAAAYTSERLFTVDGRPSSAWAPLSGFWPASDGWVRTHGNYPHHAARLLRALSLPPDAGADEVRRRIAASTAATSTAAITAAGGIATTVGVVDQAAVDEAASHPLLTVETLGTGSPRPARGGPLPLSGIRVLDLTRVIAGPVATRTLALFGADVLRIDSLRLPEIGWQHLDSGAGKRTALLDLSVRTDRAAAETLLASADVVVLGYRPAGLERLGLTPTGIAARHPGVIVAQLAAWGFTGAAVDRRGFDSIVQAASGIAWLESVDGETPGALPAQALDHSAGYLLAAAVMSLLRRQRAEGGSHGVSITLARVAAELLTIPRMPRVEPDSGLGDQTVEHESAAGIVRSVRPAPAYRGSPDDFAAPAHPWGSDEPAWLPR